VTSICSNHPDGADEAGMSEAAPEATPQATPEAASAGPMQSTANVVVVDDDSVQRLHVSQMLARLGYAAAVAADGYEALDLVERLRPDVVVMDWRMPGIDGRETARRIRQRERANGDDPVNIIGITGAARLSERSRCLEAGMDAYLVKPFGIDALRDTLTRCVRSATGASTPLVGTG